MNLNVTSEGSISPLNIAVSNDTRVGDIIKNHLQQFANSSDYNEDLEAFLENSKKDLSKDATMNDLGLKEGGSLHFSRCSMIDVIVSYEETEITLEGLHPSFTLKRVEAKAIKELGVDISKREAHLELRDSDDKLNAKLHLGCLTTYPTCKVSLDLVSDEDKVTEIVVNGRPKPFSEKKISFEQVIVLAFGLISNDPRVFYTVTYKRGIGSKPEGSLTRGQKVRVKNKMIFNATCTDKS